MFDIRTGDAECRSLPPAPGAVCGRAGAGAGAGAGARAGAGAGAATARLDAVVVEAQAAAAAVDAPDGWTGAERARALAALDRAAGVLATVRARLLVAEQRAETSIQAGDRDFVAARARLARSGLGEARREVRQAEALVGLPRVADAVAAGRVPVAHVDALARAVAGAGEVATASLASKHRQARLVRLAERLTTREFAGEVQRMVAAADPAAMERSVDVQRRERFLMLTRQPDGVVLRGRLDAVSGALLRAALDGVGIAPDESRDKPQADADALVALAERAASGMAGVRARPAGRGGGARDPEQKVADSRVSGSAQRPLVSILLPLETFVEARAARRRDVAASDGRASGLPRPVEPATLEDGTPLAMSQLARILCDCEVGRVVLDAESLPLDLGRTSRLFSAAQRRAVIIRDRACAWNGCDVPAAYCEVHHIRWWDRDDGPSDLENAVLLCSHHHHVVHRQELEVQRLRPPTAPGASPGGPCESDGRDAGGPGATGRGSGGRASGGRGSGGSDAVGPGAGVPGEPVRYRFTGPDGREVSAPPGAGDPDGEGQGGVWGGGAQRESGPDAVGDALFEVA